MKSKVQYWTRLYHNKFDDASKKMVGKSDEGGMTGVIERDSERGEGDWVEL